MELAAPAASRHGSVVAHLEEGLVMIELSSWREPLRPPSPPEVSEPEPASFFLEAPGDALPNGRRSRLARRSIVGTALGLERLRTFEHFEVDRTAITSVGRPRVIAGIVITVMAAALTPRVFFQVPGRSWIDPYARVLALVVSAAASVWTQALAHDGYSWRVALFAFTNFLITWADAISSIAIVWENKKLADVILYLLLYPGFLANTMLLMRLTRDSVADVSTAIGLPSGMLLVTLIRMFYLSGGGGVVIMGLKLLLDDEFHHVLIWSGIASWTAVISWTSWIIVAMLVLRSGRLLALEAADRYDGRQAEECLLAAKTINFDIKASSIAVFFNILHAVAHGLRKGYFWPVPAQAAHFTNSIAYSMVLLCNHAGNALAAMHMSGAFAGSARAGRLRLAKEQARQRTWTEASSKAVGVVPSRQRSWTDTSRKVEEVLSPWDAKVRELSLRGVSLKALLDFYRGLGERYMEHFEPDRHQTSDVVRHAVIPLSADAGSALACIMMDEEPTRPNKMVTHNWGNLFRDLVAAIIADALEEEEFARISDLLQAREFSLLEAWCKAAGKLKTAYWVCAFSVNQHCTICGQCPLGCCDTVTGEPYPVCKCDVAKVSNTSEPTNDIGESILCEVNKFDDMMKLLSVGDPDFEQVVAIDHEFNLFTRSWCVAELAAASEMGMRQKLKFSSEDRLNEKEGQLRKLRIQDMEASRPEDKALILEKIEDVHAFNAKLQRLLFEDLLPAWGDLDAVEQIHRLARIARWQHLERTRALTDQPSLGRSLMEHVASAMSTSRFRRSSS